MSGNGFQTSYANDRPPSSTGSGDADIASDPASSSFFLNDYKKHEDLKQMLDSNKDSLKLEAMKRIIGMVAKGKDASDLFPPVVKNVVSKNIEVKKLVYVYLTRYAEEQQDLALLSISTFQRALKDPNQLIRASALRVLSSIRVPMIVPIMMLAIKEGVMDMSPYVRKTAAHAIPKMYRCSEWKTGPGFDLDPEQKDCLIEVIEKLLADKTTLVAGSAIQAFEEVCPERIDLIHKNYRKLCNLLVDVEEWGQVVIINMLTRYARTQFVNPNQEDIAEENDEKAFYDSSESEKEPEEEEEKPKKRPYVMDPDHRLLLRTCKPLLNSRNASVVMAVAQLYHHCAPKSEVSLVGKSMVRLLRGHKEVQFVVLSNIASMSLKRKGMFEPYLKSFYVRSNDPTHVKLLKLEILTNLATETNISTILREFQTYVTSSDKEFAAATIQAIGRCASTISEITDACLNGLVSLLANRDETVVGESVVVIKKLLQMQPTQHKDIIMHLAKLSEDIAVPMARASILWLIGEYSDRVPKIAPDVLRKMAKGFINEEDIVKLQILNLAAKLCITNSKQTKLLCQYVFNLAKYDQNYDIRDRARFLRQLILPGEKGGALAKHAKKIFLATKPAPVLESKYKDHETFQLGTLSHLINIKSMGYQELPEWPESPPDTAVRNVEVTMPWSETKATKTKSKPEKKKQSFYSEDEGSDGSTTTSGADSESDDSGTTSGPDEVTDSETEESESEESSDEDDDDDDDDDDDKEEVQKTQKVKPRASKARNEAESEESSTEETSEEESSETEEESSEEDLPPPKKPSKKAGKEKAKPAQRPSEMLLDFDDLMGPSTGGSGPLLSTPGDILTPSAALPIKQDSRPQPNYSNVLGSVYQPTSSRELLNRMAGNGLSITYKFTRTMSVFSPKMVSIEMTFTNNAENPIQAIKMADKKLAAGTVVQEFPEIATLAPGVSTSAIMAIDFNDSTNPVKFDVSSSAKRFNLSLNAPVGELLKGNTLTENDFVALQAKLTGMNENVGTVDLPESNLDPKTLRNKVYEVANVLQVPGAADNIFRFAGKTAASGTDTLVTIRVGEDQKANITVNCDKMVIGNMLLTDLKHCLSKA